MEKFRWSPVQRSSPFLPRRRFLKHLTLALGGFVCSEAAYAWPAEAYRNMCYDTLRLLPPSLSRVLWRHDKALVGAVRSLDIETASRLARDAASMELSEETLLDVDARIERIASQVNELRAFGEIAAEFGRLLRVAADLADPMLVGSGSSEFIRISGEYRRFAELNLHQLPLVHDKSLPHPIYEPVYEEGVRQLLRELRATTWQSVPELAREFWRDGRVVPAESFDFRSVPYARFSLAYSRGVTAASYLWLSAWKKANGDFSGYRFAR